MLSHGIIFIQEREKPYSALTYSVSHLLDQFLDYFIHGWSHLRKTNFRFRMEEFNTRRKKKCKQVFIVHIQQQVLLAESDKLQQLAIRLTSRLQKQNRGRAKLLQGNFVKLLQSRTAGKYIPTRRGSNVSLPSSIFNTIAG